MAGNFSYDNPSGDKQPQERSILYWAHRWAPTMCSVSCKMCHICLHDFLSCNTHSEMLSGLPKAAQWLRGKGRIRTWINLAPKLWSSPFSLCSHWYLDSEHPSLRLCSCQLNGWLIVPCLPFSQGQQHSHIGTSSLSVADPACNPLVRCNFLSTQERNQFPWLLKSKHIQWQGPRGKR